MEKFCPWGKSPCKIKVSTSGKVESHSQKKKHDSESSSDSETWIQVREGFGYTPKFFADPAPPSSDKENDPPNDALTVMTFNNLNLLEDDRPQEKLSLPEHPPNFVGPYCPTCVLEWSRCICIAESDWDDMVEVRLPMPQTSSPKIGNPLEDIKLTNQTGMITLTR